MQVTDVKVFPVNEDRLKAYATITFDDCFVVRDLKIIQGHAGLFVAMPSKRRKDGTFKDTAHPLNNETREMIETKVLSVFEAELARMGIDPKSLASRRPFPVVEGRGYDDEEQPRLVASGGVPAAPVVPARGYDDGDELPSNFRPKV